MQGVNDVGGQTFVKKKPEDVVAVVSGSLKPYLYFVCREGAGSNPLQQNAEAFSVILDSKHVGQHLAFRAEDEAVVLVLRHINSNANHNDTSIDDL